MSCNPQDSRWLVRSVLLLWQVLNVSSSNVTGALPLTWGSVGALPALVQLDLAHNSITGQSIHSCEQHSVSSPYILVGVRHTYVVHTVCMDITYTFCLQSMHACQQLYAEYTIAAYGAIYLLLRFTYLISYLASRNKTLQPVLIMQSIAPPVAASVWPNDKKNFKKIIITISSS